MNKKLLLLLCCPQCQGNLIVSKANLFCASCQNTFPIIDDIPDFSKTVKNHEIKSIRKKWNEIYKTGGKNIIKQLDYSEKKSFKSDWSEVKKRSSLKKEQIYLEIGCGTFYFGRALGKLGHTVVGVDISIKALKLARQGLKQSGVKDYLLVCGNILNMPFKDNSFHLIVGFGVIEHFDDTLASVTELNRILARRGVAFNSVPYLNLGSLTYRQIWGNIPRLPVLENLYSFFHIKILRAKHMRFGFELSFTKAYLEKIHYQAGFSKIIIGRFNCPLVFEYLRFKPLRRLALYLAKKSSLFWPMISVSATK